jgi:calcineurin-like phosphoesterase family protein
LLLLANVTIATVSADAQNFSIVVLPDTQFYSERYPQIFANQTQWIVDNKDRLNIKFVIHEGDIVEDADNDTQWKRASKSMSVLDGKIPYGILPGNHDENVSEYEKYFPAMRYKNYSYWGGSHANNTCNYQLFSALGFDFIVVNLRWNPDSDDIMWANGVLKNYSERKTILVTHGYINEYGIRSVHGLGDTSYIWNELIAPNESIFLVLCGHAHGESRRTDIVDGKAIHQVLANYQERPNGGSGWLRIMEFRKNETKTSNWDIVVKTYSPYLNKYETDTDSEFKLEEKSLCPDLIDILLWNVGRVLKIAQNIIKTF